jgi:hypothetical protein
MTKQTSAAIRSLSFDHSFVIRHLSSFRSQSDDRIDAHRAARGQPRRYERDGGDQQNDAGERPRIGRGHPEEQTFQ